MKRIMVLALLPVLALASTGCETTPTTDGAVIGTALGAGLGAIVGHQSGRQGEGALIGAGAGALTGALAGNEVQQRRKKGYATQPQPAYQPQQPVYQQAPPPASSGAVSGRYETRIVRTASGETYEERVWVPDR